MYELNVPFPGPEFGFAIATTGIPDNEIAFIAVQSAEYVAGSKYAGIIIPVVLTGAAKEVLTVNKVQRVPRNIICMKSLSVDMMFNKFILRLKSLGFPQRFIK